MQTYIILLRGINVSGQKKIRMEKLRDSLKNSGFSQVKTYIQSGNILVRHDGTNEQVAAQVQACIRKDFGFDVPALVYTPAVWDAIYSHNPYLSETPDQKGLYFVFLYDTPAEGKLSDLTKECFPNEAFSLTPECIYLNVKAGYGKAKCNNNFFEQRLQVRATARNLRTVQALARMAAEME